MNQERITPTEFAAAKSSLAATLRAQLAARGWTRTDFVDKLYAAHMADPTQVAAVTLGALSTYIDAISLPTKGRRDAMAKVLGMDPEDLVPERATAERRGGRRTYIPRGGKIQVMRSKRGLSYARLIVAADLPAKDAEEIAEMVRRRSE